MTNKNVFSYSINDGFLWSEVNLKGERQYFIEGFASTIDEDKSGEILEMSAQQDIHNQIQNENITMDIEHEEWYDEHGKMLSKPKNMKIPVAKVIHSEIRPRGVWVKAKINNNLRSFTELWGSIKDGFLKAFSVAFYPTQKAGSIIKHLNLVNITLTGSPVNPNATFAVSMKSAAAWMDMEEVKAIHPLGSELTNPVDAPTQSLTNPVDTPKSPEVKDMEENKMKCKECDKEFADKDALDAHIDKAHKKEPETKCNESAEVKAMETEIKAEVKAEPIAEVVDVQAIVKAMKEKHDAEMETIRAEMATMKAELAKPVMKAIVETAMPTEKPVVQMVSPLKLVR